MTSAPIDGQSAWFVPILMCAFLLMAVRMPWFQSRTLDSPLSQLRVSTLWMLAATLTAVVAMIPMGWNEVHATLIRLESAPSLSLVVLVLATAACFPAENAASRTPLGSARAGVLDWGTFPLFIILAQWVTGHAGHEPPASPLGVMVGTAMCVGGVIAVGFEAFRGGPTTEEAGVWPRRLSRRGALWFGVFASLVASFAGALAFVCTVDALGNNEDWRPVVVLLAIRLGLATLVLALLNPIRRHRVVMRPGDAARGGVLVIVGGVLTSLPLFVIYRVLDRGSVSAAVPWFFAIPLLIVVVSVWPFRLRRLADVKAAEAMGLAATLIGIVIYGRAIS